ncbi:MAG TPA: SDR family NAD(P)-dependent oxidoreductase, partial [Acidimicrobiales bacterium]
ALPHMVEQGEGTILGVTSGSGWRAANAGGYSCAKRVIASLVWQLSRQLPPNVTINAISPIAATRMVAAAAERARKAGGTGAGGGLSLFDSMPKPEDLAPLATRLASDRFRWSSGRVVFAGGSEMALVDRPSLLEVVRLDGGVPVAQVLEATVPKALVPAEARQASQGGANPRFGALFDDSTEVTAVHSESGSCLVVSDRPDLIDSIDRALGARGIVCHKTGMTSGFEGAAAALQHAVDSHGSFDAVVFAPAGSATSGLSEGWQRTLDEHAAMPAEIEDDAGWARAVSDHAAKTGQALRLLTLIDAVHSGGQSRAQASAQLARSAKEATKELVVALTLSLEESDSALGGTVGEVIAYLVAAAETPDLAGAELVLRAGWIGLRSHPRPTGSVIYGGPALPEWFDDTMEEILGAHDRQGA